MTKDAVLNRIKREIGEDNDLTDIISFYDDALTDEENFNNLKKIFKPMIEEKIKDIKNNIENPKYKEMELNYKENYFNLNRITGEILKHKIIGIFGNTGAGKTSTSFKILEIFKQNSNKEIYIFKHPKPYLIESLGFKLLNSLEYLEDLSDCVLFIDEPQLHLNKYEKRNNEIFQRLASLCRQRNITLIFSTSDTRYINKGLEAYIDGWFIKDLRFDMVKNGSFIKNVIKRNSLINADGFRLRNNQVLYSNRNNPDLEFKFNIDEASFFSDDLSFSYCLKGGFN